MYAEGCRAAVLDRGGSASQSEITDITFNWPRFTPAHAGPWRGRCLRRRALNATRAPRFGRRLKPPALRSRDAYENSCSHAENLNASADLELVGLIQTASFSLLNVFLDPELVHASKNNRILCLKTVPMIEVSHIFVVGESPSEILEYMPREVEAKKFQPVLT